MVNSNAIQWVNDVGTTEASSLGLPPGQWPDRITVFHPMHGDVVLQAKVFEWDKENELAMVTYIGIRRPSIALIALKVLDD